MLSAADEFNLRYSLYEVDSQNSRGAGGLSAVSAAAGLHNLDQTIAASNIATISAKTVNETRGQYTHSDLSALPNDPVGPAVSISGVASFGTLSVSPQDASTTSTRLLTTSLIRPVHTRSDWAEIFSTTI